MSPKEFVEEIRNLIAKAKTEKAIELFLNYTVDYKDEIILQSSKYQYLKKDARAGTVTQEELEVKRNKICKSLLEFANEVDIKITPERELYLTDELKQILALAEYQSRKDDRPVTSTRYFFSALTKLGPDLLKPIIEKLEEKDALPDDIEDETLSIPRELSISRQFSTCVTSSLKELKEVTSKEQPIDTDDLFIDVAKYGVGPSVAQLRNKGVSRAHMDEFAETHRLEIKRRK